MPVHEFIQLWRIEYYVKNLHVCLIFITMTFQIYKSWGLLDSTKTPTNSKSEGLEETQAEGQTQS